MASTAPPAAVPTLTTSPEATTSTAVQLAEIIARIFDTIRRAAGAALQALQAAMARHRAEQHRVHVAYRRRQLARRRRNRRG